MFPVDAIRATILKVVVIFREHDIPFHLTGCDERDLWRPRMTQDIDIVIENESVSRQLDLFLDSLGRSGFLRDDTTIREAIRPKGMFQLLDGEESLKLDVYPRELIKGELERSEKLEVFEGVILPIVSRPDATVSKLIWVSKGSHKSRRDLRRIWESCSREQKNTVRRLAAEAQLLSLLDEVLHEPDELES